MREAEGQVETKKSEIAEHVLDSGRKAVAAKDSVATIETWEGEIREYTSLTGLVVENTLKILNIKRMRPEIINKMPATVDITDYNEAKEYAVKQARVLQKEKDPKNATLDLNEDEGEKKKVTFDDTPAQEETYSADELLAWMGKGPGKGNKGPGQKGSKGGFPGNCNYCGVFGHRINECRKKDADMKGKGKGQGQQQSPGWGSPSPPNGKGKGQKGP